MTPDIITTQIETLFRRHPHIRGMVEAAPGAGFGAMLTAALDQAKITDPDLTDAIEAVEDGHLIRVGDGWAHTDEAAACDGCGEGFMFEDMDNGLCHACAREGDWWNDMQRTESAVYRRSLL